MVKMHYFGAKIQSFIISMNHIKMHDLGAKIQIFFVSNLSKYPNFLKVNWGGKTKVENVADVFS